MTELFPIVLFTISSSLTPGPNNFMLMSSGLHFGIKKSLPHYFGICLGFFAMVLIIALGLGAVFMESLWLKQALKILGSAYMLYLAFQILTAHTKPKAAHAAKPLSFIQAVLFQWVNPKAWLMAVGAISIFTLSDHYLTNAVLISTMFLLAFIPCGAVWLLFGKFLQKILKEDKHRLWFNVAMAICLVASIALIFFD
ncbi:MAG: LysE family translocator [Proteobacteria bacterium]|nr:LysE family translocator [Pseudomonadota bacterium]